MSNANYPDSVNPGDPDAPWNAKDTTRGVYAVTIEVTIWGEYSKEDAALAVARMCDSDRAQVESLKVEFIEECE